MTEEQFSELIARGREQPSVEFKRPGLRTDKHLFAKVVRAILGMTNRRDGGYVIVGVEEIPTGLVPTGLNQEELVTWKYDHVADGLASYADPSVEFDVVEVTVDSKTFIVIKVEEFAEVPVLCKKGYNKDKVVVLREGACYVRSRRKPETIEVSTYADMRDLIDLATDKGVRRFVSRAHSAGLSVAVSEGKSAEILYDEQMEDFK